MAAKYPTIEEMREWVRQGNKLVNGDFCAFDNKGAPCGMCALSAAAVLRGAVTRLTTNAEASQFASSVLDYWAALGICVPEYYRGFDNGRGYSADGAAGNALFEQCVKEGLLK